MSIEQRRQLDVILKQEQKFALQYGNVRRMTVKEHSERVRFDHYLIDSYIPNNKFKRIFPLDPGAGSYSCNGDDLDETYAKLLKTSNTIWKKQVGMIQKKEVNPNIHETKKCKKRKNKKNLLTSMTSHIKKGGPGDQDVEEDQEEGPEDGYEEGQEDGLQANNYQGSAYPQRRDSAMSNGAGDNQDKRNENSGDISHVLSNR